jgi:putative mRNA 3-end processing factor
MTLLRVEERGLWCEAGGFHVDPWLPVPRALVTHGHADHARPGSQSYLSTPLTAVILRERFGPEGVFETAAYGERRRIGEVEVSFHPAGHVLGSAQIRIEHRGEIWVVSGDYKLDPDPTCAPFEPTPCHTFVTESTYGLPIYRWPDQGRVLADVRTWWRSNRERGKCSVLFAYPLGKSQRLLTALRDENGPIFCHGAIEKLNNVYRANGVELPATQRPGDQPKGFDWSQAFVLAPPSAQGSPWMKRFGAVSTAFASGWMRIRGTRRRKSIDRGFVFSDHADWSGLQSAISGSGAERVLVTHGYRAPMVRWLRDKGFDADTLDTPFEGESNEVEDAPETGS